MQNTDVDTFEVESIELATPDLFSNSLKGNTFNQDNNERSETKIFENPYNGDSSNENDLETKEPEMFEETNSEEDFEIPAFLRKQKN